MGFVFFELWKNGKRQQQSKENNQAQGIEADAENQDGGHIGKLQLCGHPGEQKAEKEHGRQGQDDDGDGKRKSPRFLFVKGVYPEKQIQVKN